MHGFRWGLGTVVLATTVTLMGAAPGRPARSSAVAPVQDGASQLQIENDAILPETYPGANYAVTFHARGGVPVLHWKVVKGTIPPGLILDDGGNLFGRPVRDGEFRFTASVKDGSNQAVQKSFVIRVKSALTADWKVPAHVSGNRIDGSVKVSNTTPDEVDLTFVVLAVAENGRATAIGYQHFVLPPATLDKELPFGDTLPRGGYVVHVDVVGEVAPKNLIHRKRLQTKGPLQVTVGP
ncbi:MAG: putative Ig domain-containing protein [Candidatus Sulfotelmatobacter sp.]